MCGGGRYSTIYSYHSVTARHTCPSNRSTLWLSPVLSRGYPVVDELLRLWAVHEDDPVLLVAGRAAVRDAGRRRFILIWK